MRTFLSWVVGFVTWGFMIYATDLIANSMGLTTFVDYGEAVLVSNRYYDEEVYGHTVGFGYFFTFISFATAIRFGMAVNYGGWSGGVSMNGNLMLVIITAALFVFGAASTLLATLFEIPDRLSGYADLVMAGGIGYLGYRIYQNMSKPEDHKNS